MIRVTENLGKIRDLLRTSAVDANRDPASVKLLAVSKRHPPKRVLEAAAAGQRDFGENTVQEGVEKIRALRQENLVWHFIGHLQSNKTRAVAEHFDWVHSVDKPKIASRLNDQRPEHLGNLNVCLQVNIDRLADRSGASPEAVTELAEAVIALPRLRLRGLMCLPAIHEGFEEQRVPFARLSALYDSLVERGIPLDTLSMGMTNDYRAAIFEGATIVRIGTAIFGPRPKSDTGNTHGASNG